MKPRWRSTASATMDEIVIDIDDDDDMPADAFAATGNAAEDKEDEFAAGDPMAEEDLSLDELADG